VNPLARLPLCPFTVTVTVTAPALPAGVVAVIVVLFTTTTPVGAVPPNVTVAPAAKFVPVIVTVVPPATVPLFGATLLTVGIGFAALIVNAVLPHVPPPGAGLTTVTCPVPAAAMSAAVIAAVNCVALTYVVVRLDPFHFTTEPLMNPVPVTVKVNAAVPAVAFVGDSVLIAGIGFAALIVNAALPDVPPPGAGLTTVTCPVLAAAMSAAVIAAVNCVALTYVVVRLDPFQFTTEPLMNPVPVTVKVNAAVPAVALPGDSALIAGIGFAALIVNAVLPHVPPPGAGLTTVTCPVPAVAMSAAVIAAVNCVALTYVVVRLDPFHFTTEPLMNPVPVTVKVSAAVPAVAFVGDSVLIVGSGFAALMVNAAVPDVPPPGAGLVTVTCPVPAAAMSAAVIAAVNCVALTYVVVRLDPFQFTTEPLMNPVPATVSVKAAVPAVALAGDSVLIVGAVLVRLMVPAVPVRLAKVPSE
jgi:hypothetical protein